LHAADHLDPDAKSTDERGGQLVRDQTSGGWIPSLLLPAPTGHAGGTDGISNSDQRERIRSRSPQMGRMKQRAHPQPEEIIMFRKISFALIAAAAVASTALAPTSASAWGRGGGFRGGGFHEGGFHREYSGGWGHRDFGYGRGWCYFHPYACE
jgi:hypothetical protein